MIKFIFTLILGIYIGAFVGLDKINKATVFCADGVKVGVKWVQTEWTEKVGETNEQK